jgi:nitrite reductase/ring-hydroxylating ferredoxin subunit/alkylhydroperoxidase/carboxymuconolactone decarboxylase family protein YurZ
MADQENKELSGLQYLSRERPEAMQHLLAFFKESSRHLDPKTRFLISIVTKVVNFSPRGLRQYIPRAVREGATPDEVMDAILCAYPAAGLTRVVDAIDVLRSLDLERGEKSGEMSAPGQGEVASGEGPAPGEELASAQGVASRGEGAPAQGVASRGGAPTEDGMPRSEGASGDETERQWVPVLREGELVVNGARVVEAGGRRIALFNAAGTYRAIANTCLHQGGFLGEGRLDGEVVTCSRHGWQFDVTNGDCITYAGKGVTAYEVRIVEGEVQVYV